MKHEVDGVTATPAIRAEALARYRAGASTRTIGAQLGVSPRTVARWVGDELRGRGPAPRVPTEWIVELREAGLAWSAVAAEVGMSKTRVQERYRAQ